MARDGVRGKKSTDLVVYVINEATKLLKGTSVLSLDVGCGVTRYSQRPRKSRVAINHRAPIIGDSPLPSFTGHPGW